MAAIALPTHLENRREAQIIDLSSDDEGDGTSSDTKLASDAVSSRATSVEAIDDAPDHASVNEAHEVEAGAEHDQALEDDEYSDTTSFVNDVINVSNQGEDEHEEEYVYERCTPEESAFYKKRLHEVDITEFVREFISSGAITAKKLITAFDVPPPRLFEGSNDNRYYRILARCLCEEVSRRQKLPQYNTFDDVVALIQKCSKIMVITGAGISTNLGIPDFRSPESGFYSVMQAKGFSSPEDIFDLPTFIEDPAVFYENSGATFAAPGKTSPTHDFIALLHKKGKLLTNYTQNIDNIEASAGIPPENLIQCHGSWAYATCQQCDLKVPGEEILEAVKAKRVAYCKACPEGVPGQANVRKRKRTDDDQRRSSKNGRRGHEDDSADDGQYDIPQPGVMKPDITFFREKLPDYFFERFNGKKGEDGQMIRPGDRGQADLVIVIGTSMKVAPVSEIPRVMPKDIPHVFISRGVCDHTDFDVNLLGDCDVVCSELAKRAGWAFRHELLPEKQKVTVSATGENGATWDVKAVTSRLSTPQAP